MVRSYCEPEAGCVAMAQTFPESGIEVEARKRRDLHASRWAAHGDAKRFFRDWIGPSDAGLAVALADCRRGYRPYRSKAAPDKYKLVARSCKEVPWCIPCTQAKNFQRARQVEELVGRFTPDGEKPRWIHCVFRAQLMDDLQGWGMEARKDPGRFLRVVRASLDDFFGPGLGGYASYQDFGERPFSKPLPHWDLLLNGWRIDNGAILPLREADWTGGDRDRLNAAYDGRVLTYGMDAKPGNSWIGRVKIGFGAGRGELAYSVREMVDLRKLRYEEGLGRLGWVHYRDGSVDWTRAEFFRPWYGEYQERVRPEVPNVVHRPFGYMWGMKSRRRRELGFIDEVPEHGGGCACRDCDDWEAVIDAATLYPGIEPQWTAPW